MLRNYITATEMFYYYPRVQDWMDTTHLVSILNSSAMVVANDLRKKGIDTKNIYIPLMLDSVAYGDSETRTDTISTSITLGNERRFVAVIKSTTGCTISVSGSVDDTHYVPVQMFDGSDLTIEANSAGTYSRSFIEGYQHIKYEIEGSADMYAYVVDTAFDQLILFKALQQICLPLLGTDGLATEMYQQAIAMYGSLISSAVYDIDRSGDGAIDAEDRDVSPRVRVGR